MQKVDSKEHIGNGNGRLDTANQLARDGQLEKEKEVQVKDHEQLHIQSGQFLKSAVYGGSDGVINMMAVILGGLGSGSSVHSIVALGMSVLVGDGIGMGLGDYLSSKSEVDYIKAQEARQFWQVQNKLEEQKKEVVDIYVENGYTKEQSKRIADLLATNPQAFVNVMMLEELQLVVDQDASPGWNGIINFISFVLLGFLPLIPYLIVNGMNDQNGGRIWFVSVIIGSIELFSLGFAKALLIGVNKWKSGFQSLFFGSAAIAIGYGLGVAFHVTH